METRYRGHATSLAAAARSDGFGLVLTLGGDGTVNEAVNGILGPAAAPDGAAAAGHLAAGGPSADAAGLPALAALPAGTPMCSPAT